LISQKKYESAGKVYAELLVLFLAKLPPATSRRLLTGEPDTTQMMDNMTLF